jgi:hypothetical protein
MGRQMEKRPVPGADVFGLSELGDPEFFRHWAELRQRITLGGKSVPCDLKREYAGASAEYRRRVYGE